MNGDDVRRVRLPLTSSGRYERTAVKVLLADVRAELARRDLSQLGPEVRQAVLEPDLPGRAWRGYDPESLDAHLDLVARVLDAAPVAPVSVGELDERILRVKFTHIKRGGYDSGEVDAFLGEVAVAARGLGREGERVVSLAQSASFTSMRRGGYDTREVDTLLDQLMAELKDTPAAPVSVGELEGDVAVGELVERIFGMQFTFIKRGGYESGEVDAFLGEVAVAARGLGREGERVVSLAQSASFTRLRRGGYDPREVDTLLDRLMVELNALE